MIGPDDPRFDLEGEPLPDDSPLLWDQRAPPRKRDRWVLAVIMLLVGLAIFLVAVLAGPALGHAID